MKHRSIWLLFWGALILACGWALPVGASRVVDNAEQPETAEEVATADLEEKSAAKPRVIPTPPEGGWSVYVVDIDGPISEPQFYILRRALKEAIANEVDVVVLKMNTPGGAGNVMLDMMNALNKFGGQTITFIDNEAMSAGSFIAMATDDIWFAPTGIMGASAAVQATGEDLPETIRLKMESYLDAKVRALTQEYRYRADVQRAMMDASFELVIDGKVINPEGKLLSLTAQEAVEEYGNPKQPLLAEGIAVDVASLLDQKFGAGNYEVKHFDLTWIEGAAKWLSLMGAVFLGLGIVMLGIEFKTPGFGAPGALGLFLIALFFLGKYGAGLSGYEGMLLFIIGMILIGVEVFAFPGTVIFGAAGVLLAVVGVVWSMLDMWPAGSLDFEFSLMMLYGPLVQLLLAMLVAVVGFILVMYFMPKSVLERSGIVLATAVGDPNEVLAAGGRSIDQRGDAVGLPNPGDRGVAVTDLRPGGQVEIEGRRFQARVALGAIESGQNVVVVERRDFSLVVKPAS